MLGIGDRGKVDEMELTSRGDAVDGAVLGKEHFELGVLNEFTFSMDSPGGGGEHEVEGAGRTQNIDFGDGGGARAFARAPVLGGMVGGVVGVFVVVVVAWGVAGTEIGGGRSRPRLGLPVGGVVLDLSGSRVGGVGRGVGVVVGGGARG